MARVFAFCWKGFVAAQGTAVRNVQQLGDANPWLFLPPTHEVRWTRCEDGARGAEKGDLKHLS